MSEIAKCPCCGDEPTTSTADSYGKIGIICCGVSIWSKDNPSQWNQYAAAMELARATVVLENAMEPLNSGKLKMGEALPTIQSAMVDQKACEKRVLEVFNA